MIRVSSVIVTGRRSLFPQQNLVFFSLNRYIHLDVSVRPFLEVKRLERQAVPMLRTGEVMRTFHYASSWRGTWLRTEVRVYLHSKFSSLLSVVLDKARLISKKLLFSLTFSVLLCLVYFLLPRLSARLTRNKTPTLNRKKCAIDCLSGNWNCVQKDTPPYCRPKLDASKLKLNNLLKFMFNWRRLLNSLATKWNSFPGFGVTFVFHKIRVCVNVGLDTLSLLHYAHRLIAVGLRNLPSQLTGSCGVADWFCILSLHFVKYWNKVKRTYVCIYIST